MFRQRNISFGSTTTNLVTGADTQWKKVVSNLENLHKYAKPDEVDEARQALKGIIGEVAVVEDGERILAHPKLGHVFVDNSGAGSENRTRTLSPEPDFEPGASTSSAIPARLASIHSAWQQRPCMTPR